MFVVQVLLPMPLLVMHESRGRTVPCLQTKQPVAKFQPEVISRKWPCCFDASLSGMTSRAWRVDLSSAQRYCTCLALSIVASEPHRARARCFELSATFGMAQFVELDEATRTRRLLSTGTSSELLVCRLNCWLDHASPVEHHTCCVSTGSG